MGGFKFFNQCDERVDGFHRQRIVTGSAEAADRTMTRESDAAAFLAQRQEIGAEIFVSITKIGRASCRERV